MLRLVRGYHEQALQALQAVSSRPGPQAGAQSPSCLPLSLHVCNLYAIVSALIECVFRLCAFLLTPSCPSAVVEQLLLLVRPIAPDFALDCCNAFAIAFALCGSYLLIFALTLSFLMRSLAI